MTVVCVIQARLGSSRLPGKVLARIGGITMLEKVIQRVARSRSIDRVVVATTSDHADDEVEQVAMASGADVIRGSMLDVLDRFNDVLVAYPDTEVIVRVTADCPFVDPDIIDDLVRQLAAGGFDFVANRLPPPSGRTYPVGLDVEVCTAAALREAWLKALQPHEREHVMPYIYETPGRFRILATDLSEDLSNFRWTVDTQNDLAVVQALDVLCGPEPFGWERVLEVARQHPDIAEANSGVVQKHVSETDKRWL